MGEGRRTFMILLGGAVCGFGGEEKDKGSVEWG